MEEDALMDQSVRQKRKAKRKKFRNTAGLTILFFFVISISLNLSVGCRRSYLALNRNNAKWIEEKEQKYLHIEAENEYELGKLEGKYLSANIANLKRIIQFFGILNHKYGFGYPQMIQMAEEYAKFIPNQYIEEMNGIDATIVGVTYEDILLQNCFVDILYGKYYPSLNSSPSSSEFQLGCTSIGYINNCSALVGQNFDFNNVFKHSLAFVHHNIYGKQAQFSLRVGGILAIPCGINSAGVSIFINVVRSNQKGPYGMPIAIRSRIAFDEATTPSKCTEILTQNVSTLGMNLLIANSSHLISIEAVPGNFSISNPDFCVNTNTYTDTYFQDYLQDIHYSKDRQNVTGILLEELTIDNSFSLSDFMSIMGDSLVYQSKPGLMGVSTLVCISTECFCKGIPSKTQTYPTIPSFHS